MLANFANYWEYFFFILIALTLIEAAVRQVHPNFYFRSGISIYRYEYAWPFSPQMYAVANKLTAIEKSQLTDNSKVVVKQIGTYAFGLEVFNIHSESRRKTIRGTLTHTYIKIDKNNQRFKFSIKLNWNTVPLIIFFLGNIIFIPPLMMFCFLPFLIFVIIFQYTKEREQYFFFRDELKLWKMT